MIAKLTNQCIGSVICLLIIQFAYGQYFDDPEIGIFEGETQLYKIEPQLINLQIPEMVYPPDGATNVPIVPALFLKTVEGADRYDWQLSLDEEFSNIISHAFYQLFEPLPSDSIIGLFPGIRNVENYKNNTTYYWRVRAVADSGRYSSGWSESFSYVTTGPGDPISKPELLSPDQNSVMNWGSVGLIWENSSGNPNWYQIQLSEYVDFRSFPYTWRSPDKLSANFATKWNRTYYWRVVAFNDHSISEFSDVHQFETNNIRILTDSEGIFDDGSGPKNNYENNLDIYWRIEPENATQVVLKFLKFDTEENYDFVTIYDGPTIESPQLGKFSGNIIPDSVVSSQGVILVRFTTDWIGTRSGWEAEFFTVTEPDDVVVGRVILTDSLEITPSDPYFVGDTLTANFTVKNIGDTTITLVKLLLGGRYNGGELTDGGYPDFTYMTITLNPEDTCSYEGTLILPEPGEYDFFIAYYIENPTEAEKGFLDENNWNTNIELGEGLTDADRKRQIFATESHLPILNRLSHWSATPGTKVTLFGQNFGYEYKKNQDYVSFGNTRSNQIINMFSPEVYAYYNRPLALLMLEPREPPYRYAIEITRWEDTEIKVVVPDDYGLGLVEAKMAFKMLTFAVTLGASGPFDAVLETLIGFFPDLVVYKPELEVDEYNQIKPTWKNWGIIALAIGAEKIPGFAVSPIGEITVPVTVTTAAGESNSLHFTFSGQAMLIDVEPSLMAHWASPCEFRVYDSKGRLTGMVEGELRAEIPADSWLLQDAILISNAADSYYFEIVGTDEGTYGLTILYSKEGKADKFIATDIPTSTVAIHRYTIDWEALAQDEAGVTIEIDADGDGIFEQTIVTGQPYIPSDPQPVDQASNVPLSTELSWGGGAPEKEKELTYSVYFDTTEVPTFRETIGPFPAEQDTIIYNPGILEAYTTYFWNVVVRDNYGITSQSYTWSFTTGEVVSVDDNKLTFIPENFNLYQNYPNPFNPSTVIRYDIPVKSYVILSVYNTLGQKVTQLVNKEQEARAYEITFDASHLPSGVYIYRLQAGEYVESRKMLYLK